MSEADIYFELYRHLQNAIDEPPQRNGLIFRDVRAEYREDTEVLIDRPTESEVIELEGVSEAP
jgi:hypothetical protein